MKGNKLVITTLKPRQWCDKDTVLLHAAFQILVDFVEKEDPYEIADWNYDEESKKAWKEIIALYKWWKEERPNRKNPIDDVDMSDEVAFKVACGLSNTFEVACYKEDDNNLQRLINIRKHLWV